MTENPSSPEPPIRSRKAPAALLAATGLLVAGALFVNARRSEGPTGEDFIVYAASTDGFGTRPGATVKVRGVEVGTVTDVALIHDADRPEQPVRITMKISRHGASFLFDRTVAHIERIQMGPGVPPFAVPPIELRTAGSSPLPPGSIVDAVGTDTMVDSFVQLSRDVGAVRALLDGLGEPLKDLRIITRALARTDGAAGRLIHDPATADEMQAMLDGAKGATSSLQKLLIDARALSGQAAPLLADMQGASKDGRDAIAGAAVAARDLPRILKSAERTLKITEELIVNLRAASVYAPELARKVDASLEETNRVVDAAQRSLILRNTVPDRLAPRTEEEVRPPVPLGEEAPE
jgi:hypothetical protein